MTQVTELLSHNSPASPSMFLEAMPISKFSLVCFFWLVFFFFFYTAQQLWLYSAKFVMTPGQFALILPAK